MANNTIKASKESIQMINLKCPNCDQILEVEDDLDTFYCKYCGGKILLNDKARLNAKVKMKEIEHKNTLAQLEMEKEKMKMEKAKMKMEKEKHDTKILIIFTLVGWLVFIYLFH